MFLKISKRSIYFFILFFIWKTSFALESLSYSGRLVQSNGVPVVGPVTIIAELTYKNTPDLVRCSEEIENVILTKGVFHLKLNLACTSGLSLTQVLSQVADTDSVRIKITDKTHNIKYDTQELHAIPFANVASQLVQLNAADGQFLKWNGTAKKWEPGNISGGSGGTVTNVSGTLPITVTNGTGTPVVSISQATTSTNGYLTSTDWNTFNSKQNALPTGANSSHYYRGDNTFQTLNTSVVPEITNLYFTNARALGVPLAGLTTVTGAIVAGDSILEAFGKTQGQINTITNDATHFLKKDSADTLSSNVTLSGSISSTFTGDIIVSTTPLGVTSAVNKAYVDTGDALKLNKSGGTVTGTLTLDGDVKVKGAGASTNYVFLRGSSSTSADYTLTLPPTAGTDGYVLKTNGAGVLSWINPSSTVAGTDTVNSASIVDGSIVDADVNASAAIAQSKIANLTTDLSNKQPLITAGTTSQYYRGDKTFVDFGTDVRGAQLTGFATGANSTIVNTDTILGAFQKVQGQINATNSALTGKEPAITAGATTQYWKGDKSWSSLQADVQALVMNSYTVGSNSTLANTDTLSGALGKIQGQINATNTAITGKETSVTAGTATQYYRGDKTWQELQGSSVENTAAGTIAATNVQSALNELDAEKQSSITTSSVISSGSVSTYMQNGVNVRPFNTGAGETGELRFYELAANGSSYTSLKAPDDLTANINYVMPSAAPTAGQVLSSTAAGVMSWITLPPIPVSSIFGRTGTVVATAGDYTATQITNTPAGSLAATTVQAALNELDTDKQGLITAGTTAQYFRGDKIFVDFETDVRATVLTGYVVGTNTVLAATDSTLAAFQKVQGQINATNTNVIGKEPTVTTGTTSQYYRGDKTWQTLNGTVVANIAAGNIAATNVQSALNELDAEKQASITTSTPITTGSVSTYLQNGVNVNPYGTSAGNTGELRFYELAANGTNYTSLSAPDLLTANINYILPSAAPTAGQVLSSTAAGVMSWITLPIIPVSSVFGRTGTVVATAGDYTASQITNTPAGSLAATTVQAALNELDTDKQGLITVGTTLQYFRGDKTFVDFGTDVRATTLTGYVVGANTAIVAADSTLAAFQKVQGQINATNTAVAGKEPTITAGTTAQYIRGDKTLSTFSTDAINSVLSSFALNSGSKPTVANTDSVVGAFGKIQKFINDINADYVSKSANQTINGTLAINSVTGFITVPTPINPNDAANKAYVDSFGQWIRTGSDIYFNSGKVGVGTSSPAYSFEVQKNFNGLSNVNAAFIGGTDSGISNTGIYIMQKDATSLSSNTSYLLNAVMNGASKMVVTGAGNIGVGTTNPLTKMQIQTTSATGVQDALALNNPHVFGAGAGVASSALLFTRTRIGDATENRMAQIVGGNENELTSALGYLSFGAADGAGVMQERMRINSSGNVGIGVTVPAAKLDVAGNVFINGGYGINQHNGGYNASTGTRELFRVSQSNLTTSGIFSLSATRNSFVHSSQWAWSTNHPNSGTLTQLSSGSYSNIILYMDIASDGSMIISANWGDAQPYTLSVIKTTGAALDLSSNNSDMTTAAGGYTRVKTITSTFEGFQAARIDTVGNIRNSAPSAGYLEMSGDLPGYVANTYPTLKSSASYIYFSVGGLYSAHLNSGGVLTAVSDRNKKENFEIVDQDLILSKIDKLPMMKWNYKTESSDIQHISPMAQDFYELFRLNGPNDKMISSIDPSGIALVGVKALSAKLRKVDENLILFNTMKYGILKKLNEHDRAIASLQEDNEKLKEELDNQKNENSLMKSYLCQKDPKAPFCKQQ